MGGPILFQFITDYTFYHRPLFNTTVVREIKRDLWDALLSYCSHG